MGKFSSLDGRLVPQFLPINWADWEGDEHVDQMNETMEGVFFRVIRELWKFDKFEYDYKVLSKRIKVKDPRNAGKFLAKFGCLFRCVDCNGHVGGSCRYCAGVVQCSCKGHAEGVQGSCKGHARFVYNEKLAKYKNNATSGSRLGTKQSKVNEIKETKTNTSSVCSVVSSEEQKQEQQQPTKTPSESPSQPDTAPFNPLTYSAPITSKSGSVYSAEQTRRILCYHFEHNPNQFWKSLNSVARLTSAIDTMSAQVPADWTIPVPAKPKTRLAGDPACTRCRGLGYTSKMASGSLVRVRMDCKCEKREEIYNNGRWLPVEVAQ